jgi:hypothetical protein
MALNPVSVARYWEMVKIEEERAPVYEELLTLRQVRAQLRDAFDLASWRPLIDQLEDQNRALAEKASALWKQILEMDGPRLTSAEINHQQVKAASGRDWLWRTQKHLAVAVPEVDWLARDEILLAVSAFYWELASEVNRLRESQQKYQRLQAEKLALRALGEAS